MALRYIIRRAIPENLESIQSELPNLKEQLGTAGDGYEKVMDVFVTPIRSYHYQFRTRKTGTGFVWVCHCIELVAENDDGIFQLTDLFGVPRPSHLTR